MKIVNIVRAHAYPFPRRTTCGPAIRAALVGVAAIGPVALAWPAQALTTQSGPSVATLAQSLRSAATTRQSCDAAPAPGAAGCLAMVPLVGGGIVAFASAPSGYGPADLQAA
jgi:hypothetical protein